MKKEFKDLIPKSIRKFLFSLFYNLDNYYLLPKKDIAYAYDLLYTYHNADFIKEPLFVETYKLVKQTDGGNLLQNYEIYWRIHVICWAAIQVKHLEGDFVDCGVNSGMYPRAIINYTNFENLNKKYYLFDTFSGMDPRFSSESEMKRSEQLGYGIKTDIYERVKKTFEGYNVEIIKGAIPETLTIPSIKKISYLSIDMNSVQPEVAALEFFWDKLISGGIIVLDDYGYPGCIEQKLAHDKFARSKNVMILSLPTCQGIIIKP